MSRHDDRLATIEALRDRCDAPGAAVLLDLCRREGWLQPHDAARLVPPVWDLCSRPMSVLSREAWVGLFRLAGYTHEHEPADPPAGPLVLYRGSDEAGELGMCWSTNPDVARWLALGVEAGRVWSAVVEPARLLAFMAAGYEDQHVVDTTGLQTVLLEGPEVIAGLDADEIAARLDALVDDTTAAAVTGQGVAR